MFKDTVTSREELRAIFGAPMERAVLKERASLDVHSRAFIASAPFVLIATSGTSGRCDVSPKGDAPGFVLVLDDRHLVVPDRPGNNRIDGFTNIVENPHVGMIFLIPGREDTLRVNGRASIVRDAEILDRLEVQGKRPKVDRNRGGRVLPPLREGLQALRSLGARALARRGRAALDGAHAVGSDRGQADRARLRRGLRARPAGALAEDALLI